MLAVLARILLVVGLLIAATLTAAADRGGRGRDYDDDQEKVWEARKRGTILPLETILAGLLRTYPGDILKIDLDDDDDYLIYEIEILTRRGIVLELEVDAHTGRLLDIEEDD
ncbi:PepSY domain-containing protein [Hyphomonas sp.]|uniref:PepSY domain-containing protein n=1 Tax=Hyphomonas sp. TaxID=87 RepID=UPI0025B98AC7|nr:PepSY domain-containing protein [Hyphomonas sp.]